MNSCHTCSNKLYFWQVECKICRNSVWQLPQILFTFTTVSILFSVLVLVYFYSSDQQFVEKSDTYTKPEEKFKTVDSGLSQPSEQMDQQSKEERFREATRHMDPRYVEERLKRAKRNRLNKQYHSKKKK